MGTHGPFTVKHAIPVFDFTLSFELQNHGICKENNYI